MNEETAVYVTAFPPGNYEGSGAGELISFARLIEIARKHCNVLLIVCSHIPLPNNFYYRIPCNVEVRYVKVRASQILMGAFLRRNLPTIFYLRDTKKCREIVSEAAARDGVKRIYFDFSQTFPLAEMVPKTVECGAFVHDILFQRYSRRIGLARLLASKVNKEEKKLLSRFDSVITLCAKDAALLKTLYGISAGVDTWEELLSTISTSQRKDILKSECPKDERLRIVFFGNLHRFDNWAGVCLFLLLFSILKAIHGCMRPHIVTIVGACPLWFRLALLPFRRSVLITGFVDNPYHWLSRGALFIAPLLTGAGIKLKIKEYQHYSSPVYGTSVAFEGIEKRPIDHEDTLLNIVRRTIEFIKQPKDNA